MILRFPTLLVFSNETKIFVIIELEQKKYIYIIPKANACNGINRRCEIAVYKDSE